MICGELITHLLHPFTVRFWLLYLFLRDQYFFFCIKLSLEPSLHNVFETPGSLSKILFINFDLLIFVIFIKFGNVQAVPWVSALEVIIQAIYQLFLSLVRNIAVVEVFLETFVVLHVCSHIMII